MNDFLPFEKKFFNKYLRELTMCQALSSSLGPEDRGKARASFA
jgi:hypothetical protein